MSDIGKRRREIDRQRRVKMSEAMKEYDETIYYPAVRELVKECEEIGHVVANIGDNGFGTTWNICSRCGTRYDTVRGLNSE